MTEKPKKKPSLSDLIDTLKLTPEQVKEFGRVLASYIEGDESFQHEVLYTLEVIPEKIEACIKPLADKITNLEKTVQGLQTTNRPYSGSGYGQPSRGTGSGYRGGGGDTRGGYRSGGGGGGQKRTDWFESKYPKREGEEVKYTDSATQDELNWCQNGDIMDGWEYYMTGQRVQYCARCPEGARTLGGRYGL